MFWFSEHSQKSTAAWKVSGFTEHLCTKVDNTNVFHNEPFGTGTLDEEMFEVLMERKWFQVMRKICLFF